MRLLSRQKKLMFFFAAGKTKRVAKLPASSAGRSQSLPLPRYARGPLTAPDQPARCHSPPAAWGTKTALPRCGA
jgi:hypothetical protein